MSARALTGDAVRIESACRDIGENIAQCTEELAKELGLPNTRCCSTDAYTYETVLP